MERKLYLVAYDVSAPQRLRLALEIVRDYAVGGQKSAFECYLSELEQNELQRRLGDALDTDEDRYFILGLDPRARTRTLGRGRPPSNPDWFYMG